MPFLFLSVTISIGLPRYDDFVVVFVTVNPSAAVETIAATAGHRCNEREHGGMMT